MKGRTPPSTILGLALADHRLHGVVLRRSNGSLRVVARMTQPLSLNPLTDDPELVGKEWRGLLDKAELRESRCLFAFPAGWLTSHRSAVPDLPKEDVASLLELEAERGFHYSPEMLLWKSSICRTSAGQTIATQLAIPRAQWKHWEKVFRAARLRPVSWTPASLAMAEWDANPAEIVLNLVPAGGQVELVVAGGGGLVASRSLEAADAMGIAERSPDESAGMDSLIREIRITLGQIPPDLQQGARLARIHAPEEEGKEPWRDLQVELEDMGWKCEVTDSWLPAKLKTSFPAGTKTDPLLVATARYLRGCPSGFEFLPPKISSWQRFSRRVSSRKLAWAGAAAALVFLLGIGSMMWHRWQLTRLEQAWAEMEPLVGELEAQQAKVRQFRSWYDDSLSSLHIMRRLTEAFPDRGEVTAKTLEIRYPMEVICTGTARDKQAFFAALDQLRGSSEIGDMKVDQIRGESPLQFVFNFQWNQGGQP